MTRAVRGVQAMTRAVRIIQAVTRAVRAIDRVVVLVLIRSLVQRLRNRATSLNISRIR